MPVQPIPPSPRASRITKAYPGTDRAKDPAEAAALCRRTKLLSLRDKAMRRNKKDDKLATCMMLTLCHACHALIVASAAAFSAAAAAFAASFGCMWWQKRLKKEEKRCHNAVLEF
ncbi:hypothetical protein ACLKA6_018100 [Drosophila palustris]